MNFFCDEMLFDLGKWLRAAGHDTKIIQKTMPDEEILALALRENRFLLSCDKHFLELAPDEKKVLYLKGNSLEEYVQELKEKIHIDWLYQPFSRCLICNSLLLEPNEKMIAEQVPSDVRTHSDHFWYCQKCQKVYWEGGHTEHMLQQLKSWNL